MTDEKKPAEKFHRMSDDELREFVVDYMANLIFTSAQLGNDGGSMLTMVFMPLMFGALTEWAEDELRQVGVLWEYYNDKKSGRHNTMPRSVNGLPIFSSMRIMHLEDWKRAHAAIARETERLKEIAV